MIFMGAESGDDETLKRMNKGGKSGTAMTLALVERMKQYGIIPELSFVLGNPPNTPRELHSYYVSWNTLWTASTAAGIAMAYYGYDKNNKQYLWWGIAEAAFGAYKIHQSRKQLRQHFEQFAGGG